jgi:trimethylguanosine synthase
MITHAANQDACPFGPKFQRYWDRRHELFVRFDEGVQVDGESLFSIKPEANAFDIASRFAGLEVLDGFCGVGGVTIALARLGKRVIAVDIDGARLEMARHNSRLYGCEGNIQFIQEDFFEFLKSLKRRVAIYLDPPWGGPNYRVREWFRLVDFQPNGAEIIEAALLKSTEIALSLPMNFALDELVKYEFDFEYRISRAWGRAIFSTVYFNALSYAKTG